MAIVACIFILMLFYFLRRRSKPPFAEGINICLRSK